MFARRASGSDRQASWPCNVGKATYRATPCSMWLFYGVRDHKQCNYANRISDEPNNTRQQYAKCTLPHYKRQTGVSQPVLLCVVSVTQTSYTSANTRRSLGSNTANIGLQDRAMREFSFTPFSYYKRSDFDSRFVSGYSDRFPSILECNFWDSIKTYVKTARWSPSVLMSIYCRSCTPLQVWSNVIKAHVYQEN
jgi:hypothetical protein